LVKVALRKVVKGIGGHLRQCYGGQASYAVVAQW
jgi:hypothetical protein